MECQSCYNEVRGEMFEGEVAISREIIAPYQEPDATCNWIECDRCSQIVCFNCCRHPASKFCDGCIARYNLRAELIKLGLIAKDSYKAYSLPY